MLDIKITPPFEKVGRAFQLIKLGAALQRAIEMLAFQTERESKKATPVDTGRLRSSINTSIGTLQARIAPHTVYAGWIHEGKMNRGGRTIHIKGGGRAGTPPGGKPFMQIGLDNARGALKDREIIKEIEAEVMKNFKGL